VHAGIVGIVRAAHGGGAPDEHRLEGP